MFISRKKYESALEEARKEGAEKVWEQQRMDNCVSEVHRRMDAVCERLSRLEEAHRPVTAPTEDVNMTVCPLCHRF